ncbi:MAG: hypothetical protein SNJ75_04275 [Gemmataceae bacterium]
MSAATELIDQLTQQGLTDPERLWNYLAERGGPSKLPNDAKQIADLFVRDGLLTPFQAQQLLEGSGTPLVVGRYRLLEPLGRSSYLAQRTDGRLAVVQLRAPHEPRPLTRPHPQLVAILDHETQDGRLFVIREYVEGRSLQERLQQEGPLAPVPVARAILDAARGLSHLHAAGLAHGAIEPSHLIEDSSGSVRLLPGVGGDPAADRAALGRTMEQLSGAKPLPEALQPILRGELESAEAIVAWLEAWLAEVAPPPLIEPKRPSSQGALSRPDLSFSRPVLDNLSDLGEPQLQPEPSSGLLLPLLAGLALLALGTAGLLWWLG